ncbi:NADH-ubiquinone oxidoreductase b12 subunit family domain-containing protein [Phthorimaea operculella]|nr:NADH-ubiquinone oxidoreductase b12 subunit family domain-containing protein [Phthorimaea operculella]
MAEANGSLYCNQINKPKPWAGTGTLEDLERALSRRGLKDPWIRNEAWRYDPGFGTRLARARVLFTRGMPLGILLAGAVVGFDKAFGSKDEHGHGEHH